MAVDLKAEQSLVQQAAMLNETTRLNSKRAVKGWIVWIIPVAIILFVVLCFVLEKATGLPFYSVLGLGDCTPSTDGGDDKDAATRCKEQMAQFSPSELNVARLLIIVAVLVIAYFVYDVFQNGPASGLFGGMAGASSMHDVRPALRNEAISTQMMLESTLNKVEAQRMGDNVLIPKGTMSSAYPSNTPSSLAGAAGTTGQATTGFQQAVLPPPQPPPSFQPAPAPAPATSNAASLGNIFDSPRDL